MDWEVASAATRLKNVEMGRELLRTEERSPLEETKKKVLLGILLGLAPKSTLADVGCFDGRFLDVYRQAGILHVDGYDMNTQALAAAESRGMRVANWDFERQRAPVGDEAYDVIVCADVIEHVYNTENLLAECRRILQKGGRGIFVTPNLVSLENRALAMIGRMPRGHPGVSVNRKTEDQVNLGHVRMGTAKEWDGLFRAMGFRVERMTGLWGSRLSKVLALGRPTLARAIVFVCSK